MSAFARTTGRRLARIDPSRTPAGQGQAIRIRAALIAFARVSRNAGQFHECMRLVLNEGGKAASSSQVPRRAARGRAVPLASRLLGPGYSQSPWRDDGPNRPAGAHRARKRRLDDEDLDRRRARSRERGGSAQAPPCGHRAGGTRCVPASVVRWHGAGMAGRCGGSLQRKRHPADRSSCGSAYGRDPSFVREV